MYQNLEIKTNWALIKWIYSEIELLIKQTKNNSFYKRKNDVIEISLKFYDIYMFEFQFRTSIVSSAIECYQCNSEYDPRCGDPFDPYSLGKVNCSLKTRLEHLPNADPILCRKTRQKSINYFFFAFSKFI